MTKKPQKYFPITDDSGFGGNQDDTVQLLYEASQRLNQTLDLDEVYQTIHEFVHRIIPCDSLSISAFDPATSMITCTAAWNGDVKLDIGKFPPVPLEPEGQGTQSIVIRTGTSKILNDWRSSFSTTTHKHFVNTQGQFIDDTPTDEDYPRSAFIVPLKVAGRVIGAVQVYSFLRDAYTERHVNLMEALALHIASAHYNALLYNQAQLEIKERIKVEEALKESRAQLLLAQHLARVGSWTYDPKQNGYHWSEEMFNIFGLDPLQETPSYAELKNLILPDDRNRFDRAMYGVVKHGKDYDLEICIQPKQGIVRTVNARAVANRDESGEIVSVRGTVQDITERKLAEEALRDSQQLFSTVANTSPALIWMSGLDRGCIWFNEPRLAFTGHKMEEQMGDQWKTSIHPDDIVQVATAYNRAFDVRQPFVIEYRFRRYDGEYRWVIDQGQPRYDATGNFVGYIGSCMDITEPKLLETTLSEREATLRAITNSAQDGILMIDDDGSISFWNPAAERITGYSPVEVLGKSLEFLMDPEHLDREFGKSYHELLHTGHGSLFGKTIETRLKHKDGHSIETELSLAPVELQGMFHLTGILRDVSERKLLQAQIEQAVKMETIGRLAGGVAHDFNNLLTVISGHTDMVMVQLGLQDPLNDHMREIMLASTRASELTRQLLAFSRKQVLEPKVINLNASIINMSKMLRRIIGEDLSLYTALDSSLGNVRADPGQVEQVIANLATNARDAMAGGGKLTIETQNVALDELFCRLHTAVTPGDYVMIAITDNGTGMSPEIKSKIFEPFYTTKEVGKGTGLGLATVYGIVKQSGGFIDVYSEVGVGTTFKIYFPRVMEKADYISDVTQFRRSEDFKGKETILVVEDEDIVREMTVKILKQYGYTVLAAQTGGDALLVCERKTAQVDLVLTDLVMPNMNGSEFVARLRTIWPRVKVLYMSGYTSNVIANQGFLDPSTPFIQKPFRMLDLLTKVKEIIAGPWIE